MTPRCLIVDDEEYICLLVHDFLTEKGYSVAVSHTKGDAVARISDEEFDLVLVDKNLPDGSGMEVIAEIRRLRQQSEIIIITGYSDLDSAIEAFSYQVFRYMKKPFDLRVLEVECAGAMETRLLKMRLSERTEELEQTNRHLRVSERRFRDLANMLPGIVLEVGADGTLLFANKAGLARLGCDFETLSRKFSTADFIESSGRSEWRQYIAQVRSGNSADVREFELLREGDEPLPVLAQAVPAAEGAAGGFRVLFLDISSRKAAEEALRRKEAELRVSQKMEAVGTLAGGVAHDFNNMLGVIRGFSDVVLLDLEDADPIREDIEGIIDATERAADLTQRLLAFGRKQILVPQIINLNAVVRGMDKMLNRLLPEAIEYSCRLSAFPLYVFADKGQLEQVLLNLAVNARDAMPTGGALTIETAYVKTDDKELPQVHLLVRDTGEGMTEETRGRIFEPFFTTKQPGKGTGLGLATVFGIVQQSGGDISVRSAPGKGTLFELRFPAAESRTIKPASVPPDSVSLRGDETVLVVEDETMLLQVVGRLLRSYGYTVFTASQPGDALLLCEQQRRPIDLLLTDVVLPRMNGEELSRRLCRLHPEMRVLYMSGYSDFTVVRQVMRENLDCFIAKPFCADDLALKVREVLSRRSPTGSAA